MKYCKHCESKNISDKPASSNSKSEKVPSQWEDIYEKLDNDVHNSNIYLTPPPSKITIEFSHNHQGLLSDLGISRS